MDCDFDDPRSVVKCYIASMHAWELQAHKLQRSVRESPSPDSYWEPVRASLDQIFEQFLTPKERTYGRNGSFQNPPEYDPHCESIDDVEIAGSHASVYTSRTSHFDAGRYRYRLKRRGGVWLIDTLKLIHADGTESPHIL